MPSVPNGRLENDGALVQVCRRWRKQQFASVDDLIGGGLQMSVHSQPTLRPALMTGLSTRPRKSYPGWWQPHWAGICPPGSPPQAIEHGSLFGNPPTKWLVRGAPTLKKAPPGHRRSSPSPVVRNRPNQSFESPPCVPLRMPPDPMYSDH